MDFCFCFCFRTLLYMNKRDICKCLVLLRARELQFDEHSNITFFFPLCQSMCFHKRLESEQVADCYCAWKCEVWQHNVCYFVIDNI